MYLQRAYCETDGQVQAWSNDPLIVCPNDPSHVIVPGSSNPIKASRQNFPASPVIIGTYPEYQLVHSYITQGSKFFIGNAVQPVSVKILASVDQGTYDILMRNSSGQTMYELTGLSNTTPQIATIRTKDIINTPVDESYVDILAKSTNVLTIRSITTYTLDNIY